MRLTFHAVKCFRDSIGHKNSTLYIGLLFIYLFNYTTYKVQYYYVHIYLHGFYTCKME